jgi:hypothetical protein
MKVVYSALLLAFAATGAVAQSDPCQSAHKTQSSCDADTTTGGGCTWCKCAALPSACWTKSNAAKLPAGVYVCDSSNDFGQAIVQNEPCLTPKQDEQLKEAVKGIQTGFDVVDAALIVAALAEKNETIRDNIQLAESVISAVNKDIVGNLTKIAEEACGNCSQITKTVQDSVNALEEALTKIEPDWKTNPIFEAVTGFINVILDVVTAVCG